ncbi:bifunctional diaminohydroxyphosphoribosylaminopyrimidine deaminase/5-amino-6-(5-phosphoribosylamino)uracil reductase RibD [Lysinibacillus sp. SGAir0095]|uniref:bifunctional diaminohydroxyphosphoribosylaminopyrimidine deaminase/5-amino-6-(5-phosphoribosylamino)uracil reductase RibD n=1 Tax=Lysinibacillus sp. SGAir0095 TaxID=2070463 RepID=UPI0010CD3653|nr:bifunctional diaminohydroxyphosphoribosylaminopyrimidine deaminase/5-amino-6-(5-phosphoribosylamino)uracil reductase RibD [Lysinibacillus sp. SGAir0095]QCR32757.1 bifunctional diaminohydroxyphosphoribosylaminopyrimidine deaminase/5-amino-6-(5-phosphoribosylamino)uracil reductase RibD [Lysinibacillus sp. SGAir0095]
MKSDREYMQLALDLAASAKGNTNPNPCVGAVIVKNGVIVGTGLHRKAGEPHAEVHAFRMAGDHANGATLYVTLEPCSHYGKTPPCAKLVKESGISRVVVATMDPNPAVAGRGINLLREAGLEVEVGLLEKEARKLNERFIHNMLTSKPFVVSKFAMTLDGKIATHNGQSKWITSEEARLQVHKLRHEMDGILVGVGTVLADNPSLTTRLPHREGKNPIRIILDSELKTPLNANVANTAVAQTIIVSAHDVDETKVKQLSEKGVQIITVSKSNQGLNLNEMLDELYKLGITDVLVEGGAELNASFLREGLINKVIVYIAPKLLGGRHSKSPFAGMNIDYIDDALQLEFDSIEQIGPDLCITAYPTGETR